MNFKSIKSKILAIVLVVLFISLGTVSGVFGVLSLKGTELTVQTILEETAKTSALAIQHRIDAGKDVASELGVLTILSDPVSTYAEKRQLLDSKIGKYGLKAISVANLSGIDLEGKDIGNKEFFLKALSGETFYSSPEVTPDGKGTVLYVAAPLWENGQYDTKIVGVVYMTLDGKALSDITSSIKIGETGATYVISDETVLLAHTDQSLVNSGSSLVGMAKEDKQLEPLAQLGQKAASGETCYGEYYFNGVNKLAVFSPIGDSDGWSICVNVYKSEFMQSTYTALEICIAISVASLIIAAIIIILLTSRIIRPIKEVARAAEELSKGNFDYEIKYRSQDEIGKLADSMRTMIVTTKDVINDTNRALKEMANGNFDLHLTVEFVGIFKELEQEMTNIIYTLSETLMQIKTSAAQVDVGSEQVSMGSQALAQGSIEQASSIEELAAAVNEISEKVKLNAENAKLANAKTRRVGEDLDSSNRKMNNMMKAMEEISGRSKEISKIIKSIEDIAFQTNILALNAAVEAARAGAAGKGFAVVADEVRNLAEKSAEAAKDTTSLIEETVKAVLEGSEIAAYTANAIREVVEDAGEVIKAIDEISSALIEEEESIQQITIGLDQVSGVVQSNSATAEQSAAASEELSGQASMLQEEVAKFTLKNM
ncbi:methyl-accepting chemotaxis protein [Clostridium aminobutyricum]|uniref:HAMP domain-containing protein n=1 Tax=Clostridium aminobutyricum TaxID=33953 RepID=A0A939IH98_CLOAM|nr:methyl-accepting chemotaxis protein [Clostridium aminobutyricum]MBN7773442.1 HAMP domain-containing protein [Clostridium aminobutyricum]